MSAKEVYESWLASPVFNEETKDELRSIAGNDAEIEDRFYRNLKFGTGGLRGVIGAGTNRMNVYTVTLATQGLANYIRSLGEGKMAQGVAIAYDSRHKSPEFARAAALTLNANGIKTYIFDSLRPTPELSFAVRKLGCVAGIVITASHNPAEYNGYKVYWEDGAQITPPHDKNILEHVAQVTDYADIKTMSLEEASEKGLYHIIPAELDEQYYQELMKQMIHRDAIPKAADDIRIVYSPLHGTGNVPVQEVLRRLGFKQVFVVPEQEKPDGDFPTVTSPNPENPAAFKLALELAHRVDADIVLASDPDADRLGAYVKDTNGVFKGTFLADTPEYPYVGLNGNMTGALMEEYVLREQKAAGTLPENGVICSTIVSTNLSRVIAEEYGLSYVETLTGFKYIGEQIHIFDEEGGKRKFVYGMEESYGCLVGDYTRDKDACSAVILLCEAAAVYKLQGRTLCDAVNDIFLKYGYYLENLSFLVLKGADGAEKINTMMETLRHKDMDNIAGLKIEAVRDYEFDTRKDLKTGEVTGTGLPKSNVLYYELERGAWLAVRPSGTEPKIKFYCGVNEPTLEGAHARMEDMKAYLSDEKNFE